MGNNRILQIAVRAALAAAAGSAMVPIAYAQQPAAPASNEPALEEVVVTGSRLQLSPNEVSVSPVQSVSALQIEQQGLVRTEDVLNNLPQVVAENSSGQSISSNGTATVSLRGLGSERTLVLVDGKRMNPGAGLATYSQPDLNQIPADLIERVDVLTGGASSVYGADAVAGVVNFVLNTHYEGVNLSSTYGFGRAQNNNPTLLGYLANAGDQIPSSTVDAGFSKDFSLIMGSNFADGKGNATVYATYLHQQPAVGYQYDYAGCSLNTPATLPGPGSLACGGSSYSATGRFLQLGGTAGSTLNDRTVDKNTGAFRNYSSATDSYNYGALSYLQRGADRYTAGFFLNYDINDKTNAYSEFMFSRNTSEANYGPSGSFDDSGANTLSCSNPLFTAAEAAALCSPAAIAANQVFYPQNKGTNNIQVYVLRRSVESGPREDNYSSDSFREVAGVKGTIIDGLTYDVYGQVGISQMQDIEKGFLGGQQVANALDVVANPTTGAAECNSVLTGTDTSCIPWNIWQPGKVTAAQLNYLEVPSTYSITATEYIQNSSVTADLGKWGVKLPTASNGLNVNVGYEFRQEHYEFNPDYIFSTGNAEGGDGAQTAINGEFHVWEAFTEMRLPIANDLPGAYDLSFETGYRYSEYSSGYDTHTFKFGLEYAPVKDVKLRGGYNRAVRAPSVGDLYAPAVVGAGGTADPCWGAAVNGLVNGHSLQFCENTGVTPTEFGHIIPNPAAQINDTTGGSTALTPEIADTFSYGFVVTPSMVPGLVASVDYYYIRIRNTIESLSTNTIVNDCGIYGTANLCGLIHRGNGTGSLWLSQANYVNANEVNIGAISTKGIDLSSSYHIDLGEIGKFSASLAGTRVLNFFTQPISSVPGSYDCAGYYGTTCTQGPTPHWRHVLNTDWGAPWAGLDLNVRWRYIGPVQSDRVSQNPQMSQTYYPGTARIGGYSYIDLGLSAPIADTGINVRVGVNNVLDKQPPIVANGNYSDCPNTSCNDNTWVGTYDTLGRYLYAHVSIKF